MDVADSLGALRRRWWVLLLAALVSAVVGLVVVFEVRLSPPGLQARGVTYAVGEGSLLVDAGASPITDADASIQPLTQRAPILASAIGGADVRQTIARDLDIPLSDLAVGGLGAQSTRQPAADQRAAAIVQRAQRYQVLFRPTIGTPVISVETQAPTEEEARALVGAATRAARSYTTRTFGGTPGAPTRIVLRTLQSPVAATVNPSGDLQALAAVAGGCFGISVFLVLLLDRYLLARRRRLPASDATDRTEVTA